MSDKVVYLAWENKDTGVGATRIISCKTCKNKTFTIRPDVGKWPELYCAACGARIGSFGWAEQEY